MNIEVLPQTGYTVLRLQGELTEEAAGELREELDRALTPEGARVVLDLGELTYVNSDGLGTLVHLNAQANMRDRRVILARPSAFVEGVLQMTRLDRFFELCATLDEAESRLA